MSNQHGRLIPDGRWRTAAPQGVTVYESSHDFITEDPTRAARNGLADRGDLGGYDVANGYRLTEPIGQQTADSEWRISITGGEIYAVCRMLPLAELYTFSGPVWLIDHMPAHGSTDIETPTGGLVWKVEQLAWRENSQPDSLLVATTMLRDGLHP